MLPFFPPPSSYLLAHFSKKHSFKLLFASHCAIHNNIMCMPQILFLLFIPRLSQVLPKQENKLGKLSVITTNSLLSSVQVRCSVQLGFSFNQLRCTSNKMVFFSKRSIKQALVGSATSGKCDGFSYLYNMVQCSSVCCSTFIEVRFAPRVKLSSSA